MSEAEEHTLQNVTADGDEDNAELAALHGVPAPAYAHEGAGVYGDVFHNDGAAFVGYTHAYDQQHVALVHQAAAARAMTYPVRGEYAVGGHGYVDATTFRQGAYYDYRQRRPRGRGGPHYRHYGGRPSFAVWPNTSWIAQPHAGYEVAIDASGNPYYVDHGTRQTYRDTAPFVRTGAYRTQPPMGTYGTRMYGGAPRGGRRLRARYPDPTRRNTRMCLNIMRGSCRYGEHCMFAHSEEELRAGLEAARGLHHDGNGTSA